jgi:hypothetical protein
VEAQIVEVAEQAGSKADEEPEGDRLDILPVFSAEKREGKVSSTRWCT